jgi:hypothetical protein
MKLFLFVLFLFWLYNYWRFKGKRKYYKKMVIVAEHRHERLQTEQSALELASAYMQVQRYADAYNAFASVLTKYKYTPNTQDIKANMAFCQKPLPWSRKLKNHDMSYWHNFMLVRFGGRRKIMIPHETYIETDNYIRFGHF